MKITETTRKELNSLVLGLQKQHYDQLMLDKSEPAIAAYKEFEVVCAEIFEILKGKNLKSIEGTLRARWNSGRADYSKYSETGDEKGMAITEVKNKLYGMLVDWIGRYYLYRDSQKFVIAKTKWSKYANSMDWNLI